MADVTFELRDAALLESEALATVWELVAELGQRFDSLNGKALVGDQKTQLIRRLTTGRGRASELRLEGASGSALTLSRSMSRGRLVGVTDAALVEWFGRLVDVAPLAEGTLHGCGTWSRRGQLGYSVPEPGWLMLLGGRLAKMVRPSDFESAWQRRHGVLVQLAPSPAAMTAALAVAFEAHLFDVVRRSVARQLGYDFGAVVERTLAPLLAALGLERVPQDDVTLARFRGGARGLEVTVDLDGVYGVRLELQFTRGGDTFVHWPEKPKAKLPPLTNTALARRDVERHLTAISPQVQKAAGAWFAKLATRP